ncbi:hypothetical protein G7Z17_g5046 [Cylindrodendrum hubeiense]|uniref:Uncharacterized protein n=1 Tax=Cylindrodendrum hubeiense TaxID=595255 RepID=A0A9P5HHW5_9HYPO|nr:hypothetical protein G7Z17_g5046 [Cylindrodendrum hubeiense]
MELITCLSVQAQKRQGHMQTSLDSMERRMVSIEAKVDSMTRLGHGEGSIQGMRTSEDEITVNVAPPQQIIGVESTKLLPKQSATMVSEISEPLITHLSHPLERAGADRFIEDESNMSPTQHAWEQILTKRGALENLDRLKLLFPNDDLDYYMFSSLHNAVLGIEGFVLSQALSSEYLASEINATDSRQRTALHWAALRGDLIAVESLLNAGADVHAVDSSRSTPLLYAASVAVPRILELLLLSGADVNFNKSAGNTPLHYAARHKDDLESVMVLIRAGAHIDDKNTLGNSPLAGAAITNRVVTGKYLLKCGADRYSTNKYGDTPLRETIHHNCHGFLRMLLEDGIKCNDINKHGSSLLHALALEGNTETVQILKAANLTNVDARLENNRGETAMDICQKRIGASEGFSDTFSELLSTLTSTS